MSCCPAPGPLGRGLEVREGKFCHFPPLPQQTCLSRWAQALPPLFFAFNTCNHNKCPILLDNIGQQAEKAGPLDRFGQFPLFFHGNGRDPAGNDFAPFGNETLQQLNVFIVDLGGVFAGKRTGFAAAMKRPAYGELFDGSHNVTFSMFYVCCSLL